MNDAWNEQYLLPHQRTIFKLYRLKISIDLQNNFHNMKAKILNNIVAWSANLIFS